MDFGRRLNRAHAHANGGRAILRRRDANMRQPAVYQPRTQAYLAQTDPTLHINLHDAGARARDLLRTDGPPEDSLDFQSACETTIPVTFKCDGRARTSLPLLQLCGQFSVVRVQCRALKNVSQCLESDPLRSGVQLPRLTKVRLCP